MKARSNIIQICWPESAASRSLNFGMLEQHSEQRFCHDASVVDVFNQKVQTKIKAIIEKKDQSADCPRHIYIGQFKHSLLQEIPFVFLK